MPSETQAETEARFSNSIWNVVKRVGKRVKYASWPKPFNAISRIDVLNCNEVLLMRVEFIAEIIGEMIWDSQVPSPRELFRNWVFGNLRCGSKMGIRTRLPGPGNLFLDKKGKVMLAEWGGIIGAPLLYWSMGQTALTALNTWNTIQNVQAFCENPEAHGLMRDNQASAKIPTEGVVPFGTVVYDPFNWAHPTDGWFEPPFGNRMGWAVGTLANSSPDTPVSCDMKLQIGSPGDAPWTHYDVPPLEVVDWQCGWQETSGGLLGVRFRNNTTIPGVLPRITCTVTRFMITLGNDEDPNRSFINGPFDPFPNPSSQCFTRFADGL